MHTIRLRGPWSIEPVERYILCAGGGYERSTVELPLATKATMPADWGAVLGPTFLGLVRYQRNFQKPTGLESGERVWLVVEWPRSRGRVELNRKRLGDVSADQPVGRFDITELLADHNRLEILVSHPALDASGKANDDSDTMSTGGLIGDVRLEIVD